jgi:hypothetical protein
MKTLRYAAAIILLVSLAGCDALWGIDDTGDGVDASGPETAVVEPGLLVRLTAPDTVTAGDAFTVRFSVQNQTERPVDLTTPSSCLAYPGIYVFGGDRVPFVGASTVCAAAITTRTIPVGNALTQTYDMRAALSPSGNNTVPAPTDRYTVQATINWSIGGETVPLSTLGRSFLVRP